MTALTRVVGLSQIMFGTDFPYEGPVAEQANDLKNCGAFSANALQAVYYDNVRNLMLPPRS
jgi:hypothetical protein